MAQWRNRHQQKFKEALPLVPGVIRTPDGKLNIKGSAENQGMLLVDSAQTVDPVTGSFAIEIPIDAVETLTVQKTPYGAENGGFSGGLTVIETTPPFSQWRYDVMDFIPSPRGRSGHLVGVADDTPRLVFGGPLLKNKLNFSEFFEYEVIKRPVRGLAWPHNETKTQGFESFSSFQYIISARHLLTVNLNVFPLRRQFANISSLVPQTASSDYGQRGFSLGATDHYQFASGAVFSLLFNYTRFSSYAHGQGPDPMLVTDILRRLSDGASELMCHPGYVDADLMKTPTRLLAQREVEIQALIAFEIRKLVKEQGIRLMNYRDLVASAEVNEAAA